MPDIDHTSRRRFLAGGLAIATYAKLQAAAQAFGFAPETEVCRLMPEQEVGPYYVPGELLRADITEGKPGVPLTLRLVVLDVRTCQPLPLAAVDIWHCDAIGLYSGFTKQNPMGPGGPPPGFDPEHPENRPGPPEGMAERMGPPPENHPTDVLTFLRGIQITAASGVVLFHTVFPGYYMGRTNHIHFKVRAGGKESERTYRAGHTSHTGQVFFPEDLAVRLMAREPYSRHRIHRTTQAEDQVYGDQHGELSVARIAPVHADDPGAGFHAELIAAVDPSATPAAAGRRRGGPPPRMF
jgi:protocatechuate 3,4-dioxygenase beta subunit